MAKATIVAERPLATCARPVDRIQERKLRYQDLLRDYHYRQHTLGVIGCGAVGRVVAKLLGVMGFEKLVLVDPDVVSPENMGTQGWNEADIGDLKTEVLRNELKLSNAGCNVKTVEARIDRVPDGVDIAFLCVDSLQDRIRLMESCILQCKLILDVRMLTDLVDVYAVEAGKPESLAFWTKNTIGIEPFEGRCTMRSTLYAATLGGSRAVSLFTQWLRGLDLPYRLHENLLMGELAAN